MTWLLKEWATGKGSLNTWRNTSEITLCKENKGVTH
jgi:hypothetical protein